LTAEEVNERRAGPIAREHSVAHQAALPTRDDYLMGRSGIVEIPPVQVRGGPLQAHPVAGALPLGEMGEFLPESTGVEVEQQAPEGGGKAGSQCPKAIE
jgi:hypothetical protein